MRVHWPHLLGDNLHHQILPGGSGDRQAGFLLQVFWPVAALPGSLPTPGEVNILRLLQNFHVYSELSFELS